MHACMLLQARVAVCQVMHTTEPNFGHQTCCVNYTRHMRVLMHVLGCVQDSTEMRVTGSPPSEPHTTVAQRAALGQLVPNSISSEVSERRAQAFSDVRAVEHPDGDDAMAHALAPAAGSGSHAPMHPSLDLNPDSTVVSASAADSASGAPVATADNGTPVASPAVTQDAAPVATDNPYVVIQKSGAPAQPSSARLFYQPPTSLNANAPGSINSNAAAQAGTAAGAAMLAAQTGGTSTSSNHPSTTAAVSALPVNSVVSSAAPSNSNAPTATDSAHKRSAPNPPHARSANQSNGTAAEAAVPVATGASTLATTAAAISSTPLSTSPPAPGTPTSMQQCPRVSQPNSLYSQAFGRPQRSGAQPSRGAARTHVQPAAVHSVGFTYSKKPYNAYGVASIGGAPASSRSVRAPAQPQFIGGGDQNGHLQAVRLLVFSCCACCIIVCSSDRGVRDCMRLLRAWPVR